MPAWQRVMYIQVRIDYSDAVSEQLKQSTASFFEEKNPGCSVNIHWVKKDATPAGRSRERGDYSPSLPALRSQNYSCTYPSITDSTGDDRPRGYKNSPSAPVLHGLNHCHECLCSPCIVQLPPDFLRGSCGPHPANANKRFRLYKLFWGLLKDVGVWRAEEYLRRKEKRTRRGDRREIIPHCIKEVMSMYMYIHITL